MLVVGGGIHGCGIARDLAGRGWRVLLCEQDDLGAHTSSASSKLIHGGLRYLEHGEFSLVRKALAEREVLMRSAPHIMGPLRLVMPHDADVRPAWMVRAGLFLYDHLSRREILPASRRVDLRAHAVGVPLQEVYQHGFIYSDGWVDDARLVVLCAVDARSRGAEILTRSRCVSARRASEGWHVRLQTPGGPRQVHARMLVNAAGPWADAFLRQADQPLMRRLRLVKGSHIVVPRLFSHRFAYVFQTADRRIVFAMPYEDGYTLIGTTEVELHSGYPAAARIDSAEIDYLCKQVNRYFVRPVTPGDVVWNYSGVRPLLDDAAQQPSTLTRDYLLDVQGGTAPLLTVWGGKITTFRKLAEEAADAVGWMLGQRRRAWTQGAFLAGGDLSGWVAPSERPAITFDHFAAAVSRRHAWLPAGLAHRYARAYGARVSELLGDATSLADLGEQVTPGLYERELRFLQTQEWAMTGDDVLWRRTKLGLRYGPVDRMHVALWMRLHAIGPLPPETEQSA